MLDNGHSFTLQLEFCTTNKISSHDNGGGGGGGGDKETKKEKEKKKWHDI